MKINIAKRKLFKSSLKLKIKRKNGKLFIENNSSKREKIIFARPIKLGNKKYSIINNIDTLKGENCQLKLINRKFKVIDRFMQNSEVYVTYGTPKYVFIGVSFEPHSKYKINELSFEIDASDSQTIENHFVNDILVITTGYPSYEDKYNTSFVHSRVNEYKNNNINVDVAVVNDMYVNRTELYDFEGIKACRTGFNQIRMLLLKKHYSKILIHFIKPAFLRILDAVDIKDTQILLYTHGVDTLYHAYERIGIPYNVTKYQVPDWVKNSYEERDELIKRFNSRKNVKFIFGSKWNLDYAEKLIGIKFNNYEIIPNFIDDKLFKYTKKDPELRKKVFVIRPQNNLKSYSMDINVRVILELSRRECFKDMEFSIYGTGTEHYWLFKPLEKFENVHIYNKFLTHEEIAKMHQENGIGLFASRFDTMGVSACEAAMSGNIVVTSKGIGTEEYIDPKLGTYCDTEKIEEYADIIEKIYNDPKLFSELSEKTYKSVFDTCSSKYTMKKDIELIKKFKDSEEITIPTLKKNPLLSISIAGYNISSFVIQLVCSLLRSKHADELEILVVNDGSKDDTVEKTRNFIKKYYKGNGEPNVRLIDKPNGGHGSTINKGIELATGKYFKLLDGDDYFISEELDKLIEILKTTKSDLVLTDYVTDYAIYGSAVISNNCLGLAPGVEYNLDDSCYFGYGFGGEIKWGPQLHTSTYKTSLLKEANFKIDEHCFYVDMEFNLIGLIQAKTITYYPLHIYSYYVGREGQSVTKASYIKNVLMHEKVCLRLIQELYDRNVTGGKRYNIVTNMIEPLCKMQYDITTEYFKKSDKFRSFDKKLKKYPEFYNDINIAGRRVRLIRKNVFLFFPFRNIIKKISDRRHR